MQNLRQVIASAILQTKDEEGWARCQDVGNLVRREVGEVNWRLSGTRGLLDYLRKHSATFRCDVRPDGRGGNDCRVRLLHDETAEEARRLHEAQTNPEVTEADLHDMVRGVVARESLEGARFVDLSRINDAVKSASPDFDWAVFGVRKLSNYFKGLAQTYALETERLPNGASAMRVRVLTEEERAAAQAEAAEAAETAQVQEALDSQETQEVSHPMDRPDGTGASAASVESAAASGEVQASETVEASEAQEASAAPSAGAGRDAPEHRELEEKNMVEKDGWRGAPEAAAGEASAARADCACMKMIHPLDPGLKGVALVSPLSQALSGVMGRSTAPLEATAGIPDEVVEAVAGVAPAAPARAGAGAQRGSQDAGGDSALMQGTAQSPDQDTASDGLEAERAHFRAFLPKLEFPSESLFLDDYMKLLRFAFETMTQSERDRIQKQLKRHVKVVSVKGRWWLRDEVTRMLARHAFASDVSSWMPIVFSSFTTDDPLVAPLKTDAGLCAALGRAETAAAEIVLPPFVGEVFTRRRLADLIIAFAKEKALRLIWPMFALLASAFVPGNGNPASIVLPLKEAEDFFSHFLPDASKEPDSDAKAAQAPGTEGSEEKEESGGSEEKKEMGAEALTQATEDVEEKEAGKKDEKAAQNARNGAAEACAPHEAAAPVAAALPPAAAPAGEAAAQEPPEPAPAPAPAPAPTPAPEPEAQPASAGAPASASRRARETTEVRGPRGKLRRNADRRSAKEPVERIFARPAAAPVHDEPAHVRLFGYVAHNTGDFYNLYAVEDWTHGGFVPFPAGTAQLEFPQWGGVNLRLGGRKPPKEGAFYVADFAKGELDLNRDERGGVRADYKFQLAYDRLVKEGRFRSAADFGLYLVVTPLEPVEPPQLPPLASSLRVTVTGSEADDHRLNVVNEHVLLECGGVCYGPLPLRENAARQLYVNLSAAARRGVVECWRRPGGPAAIPLEVFTGRDAVVSVRYAKTARMERCGADLWSDDELLEHLLLRTRGMSAEALLTSLSAGTFGDEDAADVAQERAERAHAALARGSYALEVRAGLVDFLVEEALPHDRTLMRSVVERAASDDRLARAFADAAPIGRRLAGLKDEVVRLADEEKTARAALDEADAARTEAARRLEAVKAECAEKEKRIAFLEANGERIAALADFDAALARMKREETELTTLRDKVLAAVEAAEKKAAALGGDVLPERLLKASAVWRESVEDERYALSARMLGERAAERRRLAAKPPKGRELADLLVSRLREVRRYDRNMVLNLYLSVVQNFLTVFAGEPGAGKTSVCRLIAGSLGLTPERMPADLAQTGSRFVEVPVEYGWTTKRDLIGYWNPLSNRFESPDPDRWSLIRTLDAEARSAFGSCWPAIMLLDEANLSPMEYYWSDWMRLCDETEKASDGPAAVSLWDKGKTLVPPTLRFVATINNDSTTEPLSPRLIDRAAVITLPQLVELDAKRSAPAGRPENAMVTWEDLTEVFGARALGREAGDVRALLEEVDRHAQTLGIRLSPRSRRQVEGYVGAAAALFDAAEKPAWVDAVDFAVMQKVLPRISGTGGRYREGLDALLALLAERGLERSAERLRSVVASGEDAMDCYRFF